jgi:hypothetical protein
MREATVTALTPDPAQPLTLESLHAQLCALRRQRPGPVEALELTAREWTVLLASPEVARLHMRPDQPTFMGLPVVIVDNERDAALRMLRQMGLGKPFACG